MKYCTYIFLFFIFLLNGRDTLSQVKGIVSTFAGKNTYGSLDGKGEAATFNKPTGLVISKEGNIYLADRDNNKIRKITKAGIVTTLAGNGTKGFINGAGHSASFNWPSAIAIDALGNLYIADQGNNMIRKINSEGIVSTFAGNGTIGSKNGSSQMSTFNEPIGIAVDGSGNVYVVEFGSSLIRKITPQGQVSTFAGGSSDDDKIDGVGTAASFFNPTGIAVDKLGNIFVADQGNNLIRKITPQGLVTILAGKKTDGNTDGVGNLASFSYPSAVTVDVNGNVFVADELNKKIRKISATGIVTTLAGTGIGGSIDGAAKLATFYGPHGIAVDNTGNIFIVDGGKLRKLTIQ